MGLRTATLATGTRPESRSAQQWRALVDAAVADAARALSAGQADSLARIFATVAGWDDPQRAHQARRQLAELVLGSGSVLPGFGWVQPYAVTAEALADVVESEPREPVLLNTLGVLLYELMELRGARACFEAAARLDPDLEHVRGNLEELGRRERKRPQLPLAKGFAARLGLLGSRAQRTARRAQPARGLTLSLCMIVKDEEEMLPGCLEAARETVDEIVVVDTGSTDRTVEIAEAFGAKVVSFPWNGSFADARNVSLAHATGDWIVYLDADEHLFPEDAPLLRDLLGRTWREGFYLVETNYTGGDEAGHAVTHMALRVFRNRPQYRFEGRIHEQKTQTMPIYLPERFETTTIRLRHFGYLKNRLVAKDKSSRNIELLEQERREAPSPFNSFNLGSEHMALGAWEEARRHLDEAWAKARELQSWQGIPYVPLLVQRVAQARREAGDLAAARTAVEEGLAAFPDHTDLAFEKALCARDDGDHVQAAALAERCLGMGDAPARYAATVGTGSHLALALLGDIRRLQDRSGEAEQLYRRALAEHPDFVGPILPLVGVMLGRGATPDEVAAVVPAGKPSAMLLLATGCYEAGRPEAAEAWFRAVLERQPGNGVARVGLVESLLSQRRYEDAAAEARLEPADSPVAPIAAVAELFALAASGNAERLDGALARAQEAGVARPELDLYRAWQTVLAGGEPPAYLPAAAAAPGATALEALLRVEELEAFERLAAVFDRVALGSADRRHVLAQIYLRRGFLDSAAEEWIAAVSEAPDARSLVGLAQVALAQGLPEDAAVFAEEALALAPDSVEARRLHEAAAGRVAVGGGTR